MTARGHARAIAKLVSERIEGNPHRLARHFATPDLAAALGARALIEDARTRHLATLDADSGLTALCLSWQDILAETIELLRQPRRRCPRCGARLPRRRRHCSRCHMTAPG